MAADTPHREIRIQVRSIGRLFNSFDPSPFYERDIDDDAEEYIVDWARELPRDAPFRIVIELPAEEATREEAAEVPDALTHYFAGRADRIGFELRELLRIGWRSLAIGIAVLTVCLVASQAVARTFPEVTIARVVEESLILLGWVANWRPMEIYLYDWWPIARRRRLYRRIATAPVVIVSQ